MCEAFAMKFMTILVKYIMVLLDTVGRLAFGILYWNYKPKKLPPITNKLLLESASNLAIQIRKRKVSSEEVVRVYIERIKSINDTLNAVVDTRFEHAIEEAKAADAFLKDNPEVGDELQKEKPLFGVPMTIKECFQVEGLHQTAGIYSRRNMISTEDAPCVTLLKDTGAIVMAVTNVPEICMWWETYNSIYGRTNNPYDVTRIVGGSSGGEAANLSGCGSPLALGSDIGGSIRMPAYFNGVFGHKATPGMVDNSGQEPDLAAGLEKYLSSGPICRHACDLKTMFKIVAGSKANMLKLDTEVNFKKLKIYYMEDDNGNPYTTPVDKELKQAIVGAVNYFKTTYDTSCVKLKLTQFRGSVDLLFAKMCGGSEGIRFCHQLADHKGEVNVWKEFPKWIVGCSSHTYPPMLLGLMEKFAKWRKETPQMTKDFEELDAFFSKNLDENTIFLFPTSPNEAPYHRQPLFRWFNPVYTAIFNVLGLPATACPMGLNSNGLPLGIQVVAGKYHDHLCFSVAEELEKAFGGWVCPSEIQC